MVSTNLKGVPRIRQVGVSSPGCWGRVAGAAQLAGVADIAAPVELGRAFQHDGGRTLVPGLIVMQRAALPPMTASDDPARFSMLATLTAVLSLALALTS